jgi:hypothetical protein
MLFKKYKVLCVGIIFIVATINTTAALNDIEKTFYKTHQDAFIQKIFLDNPQEKFLCPSQLLLDAAVFLIPASLSIFFTESSRQGHSITIDPDHAIRNLIIAGFVGSFFLWLYLKHRSNSINRNTLEAFLYEYNSDLEKMGTNNLKHYIPQDLVETFDIMFQKHQKASLDHFSNQEIDTLIKSIQKEIAKRNPTVLDRKALNALITIICITAITLVVINKLTLDKVQKSLHILQQNIDYWGAKIYLGMSEGPRQRI